MYCSSNKGFWLFCDCLNALTDGIKHKTTGMVSLVVFMTQIQRKGPTLNSYLLWLSFYQSVAQGWLGRLHDKQA